MKNEDTDYKKALLRRLTSMYEGASGIRVGELALVGISEEKVVCDLIFDDAWMGAISNRYFPS